MGLDAELEEAISSLLICGDGPSAAHAAGQLSLSPEQPNADEANNTGPGPINSPPAESLAGSLPLPPASTQLHADAAAASQAPPAAQVDMEPASAGVGIQEEAMQEEAMQEEAIQEEAMQEEGQPEVDEPQADEPEADSHIEDAMDTSDNDEPSLHARYGHADLPRTSERHHNQYQQLPYILASDLLATKSACMMKLSDMAQGTSSMHAVWPAQLLPNNHA